MEKNTKTYEEDRYRLSKSEITEELLTELGYGDKHGDKDRLLAFFNTNYSGSKEYKKNFLNLPEVAYTSVDQIKEQAKKLGLKEWTVVSFYQENGYVGIYTNSSDDALVRKCNNWVNDGKDGFYYVVFAKDNKELGNFISALTSYMNEGLHIMEIYDELEEDYVDSCLMWTDGYEKWKKEAIKKYGFEEKSFYI